MAHKSVAQLRIDLEEATKKLFVAIVMENKDKNCQEVLDLNNNLLKIRKELESAITQSYINTQPNKYRH